MASTLDAVIFAGAPLVALLLMSMNRILEAREEVRENWLEQRCNPLQMPFVALFQDEVGAADNFNYCLSAMGKEVLRQPMDSIQAITKTFTEMMATLAEKLSVFREIRKKLTGFMLTMVNLSLGKITQLLTVFTANLQKIRDMIRRMVASGQVGMLFGQTLFTAIKAFWNFCLSIIRGFVQAMLAIAVALALFQPWFLAIVVAILALLGATGGFSNF